MLRHLLPEANLVHVALLAQLSRGDSVHVGVVVVEVAGQPMCAVVAGRRLLVDVWHVLLTEGAVVKPVIAAPAVHMGFMGTTHFNAGCGCTSGMSERKPS